MHFGHHLQFFVLSGGYSQVHYDSQCVPLAWRMCNAGMTINAGSTGGQVWGTLQWNNLGGISVDQQLPPGDGQKCLST